MSQPGHAGRRMRSVLALAALASLGVVSLAPAAVLAPEYRTIPLVRRMDAYFRTHQTDGVTLDARYAINPSEAIRQGVVCQLLGYCELLRTHPTRRFAREVARHADYLTAHLLEVNSGTPFDGMLGYSLTLAYEVTHDSTHLAAARVIAEELEGIPTEQCVMNGGLMVAMHMDEWARVTGDTVAARKADDILAMAPGWQHVDGCFPHWCWCTRDMHYTGWMSQELILLERRRHDPRIEQMLVGTLAFLEGRIDADGRPMYEGECPDMPGCLVYYDSRRSGCSYDYETRGITVEPGYEALVFGNAGSPMFERSMTFLSTLERDGTFKDKWDFIEPPDDPQYPWSSADTSVANMSILFWSMATLLSRQPATTLSDSLWYADGPGEEAESPEPVVLAPRHAVPILAHVAHPERLRPAEAIGLRPGPTRASACDGAPAIGSAAVTPTAVRPIALRRVEGGIACRLTHEGEVTFEVLDVAGRRLESRRLGRLAVGDHVVPWSGRHVAGMRRAPGIVLVHVRTEGAQASLVVPMLP